eukprot:TRINITY_DN1326_c0_g1_i1.p1 TRINITY_DN1326_c0_g1~~TRINITY_DN1326_c0_g1_i1.p1  ORF type:complete len:126 (-),score=5.27 TRINITY_DN1326_c0_g1_i1:39-416(-)
MSQSVKEIVYYIFMLIVLILGILAFVFNLYWLGIIVGILMIGTAICGAVGNYKRNRFLLWLALLGFAILVLLRIIDLVFWITGEVHYNKNDRNVQGLVSIIVSLAFFLVCLFLTWDLRGRDLSPN